MTTVCSQGYGYGHFVGTCGLYLHGKNEADASQVTLICGNNL